MTESPYKNFHHHIVFSEYIGNSIESRNEVSYFSILSIHLLILHVKIQYSRRVVSHDFNCFLDTLELHEEGQM